MVGSIRRFARLPPVSNGIEAPSGPTTVTSRPSGSWVTPGLTSNCNITRDAVAGRGS